jgi:hypothetical protein
VSVRAVVEIAGRVLALADAAPQGAASPRVTPVRVDELALTIDVLDPALRDIGATVLDIGVIAAEGCADTISDDGREAVICAALEHPAAGGTRAVVFAEDEHARRRAFWTEEREAGKSSPSNHPLLGLATATIDERLTTPGPLVVVFYDEALLDPIEQPVAWDYATKVMPAHLPGPVEHFVLVVASEGPRPHQLRGDPSLRWSADGPCVAQRNLATTNAHLTTRLINSTDSHLVLFLAAGFSASMGMPLGNKMRDYALRRLLPGRAGVSDAELPAEFYALVADQGRLFDFEEGRDVRELERELTFERVLREELRAFTPSPTLAELERYETAALAATPVRAVRQLKAMLRGTRKVVLVTVNFDRLIENEEDDRVEVFADDASFEGCADYIERYLTGATGASKVPLLKLHGSFAAQDTLVASIEQTLTGLTATKAQALDRACSGESRVPFVYVGSSMRDLDIALQLGQPRFASALDEYWVMPLAAASVLEFVNRRRLEPWRAAGVRASLKERLITWTADEFFQMLAAGWT